MSRIALIPGDGISEVESRVAILASDPYHYGGAWTADASQKRSLRNKRVRDE